MKKLMMLAVLQVFTFAHGNFVNNSCPRCPVEVKIFECETENESIKIVKSKFFNQFMTKLELNDLSVNLSYDEYSSGPHYKSYLGYSKASQLVFVFTYDEYILRNGNIGYMGEKLTTIDLTNGTTKEVSLFCN